MDSAAGCRRSDILRQSAPVLHSAFPTPSFAWTIAIAHESRLVHPQGPDDAHAFDGIPVQRRSGELDRACPLCLGHGQWNIEYDLASQRSKRHLCNKCDGRGWIEVGEDLVPSPDIALDEGGKPRWFTRLDPSDDRE